MHPDQLRKLVRKWTIPVVAMTLIGAVIAFLVSKSLTPTYEATGDVLVLAGPGQTVAGNVNLSAVEATTTAATLLTEPPVLQNVIDSLHLNVTTEALGRQVSAIPRSNTDLVEVTVRDPSAQNAATIANAIISAYVSGDTARGTHSVAVPAAAPLSQASTKTSVNTALGAVAGFALALGLMALLDFLDQGLHTAEDVRDRLGLPCLGVIPYYVMPRAKTGEDAPKLTPKQQRRMEAAREAYRRLRTNMLFASADLDLSSVVLTSARVGEGTTRTAANLAMAMANSDKRVVLIDANMRRPSQHRLFDKPLELGVSELILATTSERLPPLNGTYATHYDNLTVITSGMIPPNPSELLASKRASGLFHALAATYDMVIIDTPPAGVVTDALSVAAECSATVVVIEAGKTNAGQASKVIASLRNVSANVIGVVLNKARERNTGQYYQYGYAEKAPNPSAEQPWAPSAEGFTLRQSPSAARGPHSG